MNFRGILRLNVDENHSLIDTTTVTKKKPQPFRKLSISSNLGAQSRYVVLLHTTCNDL